MEEESIRHIIYSDEFEEYYASMNEHLKKKDTKQYKAEIKKAGNIVKRYLED